ncbi:MAG: DedA family protein [Candidatus Dormibacteria bacterium]
MYGFLLFWLAAESVGVPLPDEAVLLTVGFLAHIGSIQLAPAVAAAAAGAVIGSSISYTIGLRLGRPAVARIAGRVGIGAVRLERSEDWMRRRGGAGVFLTRVLPVARNVASYAAGIAGIPPRVFFPAMVVGSTVWCITVVVVGDLVGAHYKELLKVGGRAFVIAVVVAVLILAGWLAWRWYRSLRARRHPEA